MDERLMYLPAGTSDETIRGGINELNAEGKPHAGQFGTFSTRPSAGSTHRVALLVYTATKEAYDALRDKLGAVPLK
jgi:hypothetical protein